MNIYRHIFLNESIIKLTLFFIWLILQSYWFLQYGVREMGDTANYLNYAHNIADNFHFEKNHYFHYLVYPLFLAFWIKLCIPLEGIIIAQIIISGFSAIALYKTTKILSQNLLAPALATFIYITWYDLQMFNGFILTESVYISLLIITFWLLVNAENSKYNLIVFPLIILICFLRPNGFIVLVAYITYLLFYYYHRTSKSRTRQLIILLAICALTTTLILVNKYLLNSFGGIINTYIKGQVIFMYDGLIIKSEKAIQLSPSDTSTLEKLYFFIKHNTFYFFKMAGIRFLLFWGHIKPYYSLFHNLLIVAVFYPLYFFTVKTMFSKKIKPEISVFAAMVLVQQTFITTMTSEDWTGRFLLSVIPLVFIYGSVGISWIIMSFLTQQHHTRTPSRS